MSPPGEAARKLGFRPGMACALLGAAAAPELRLVASDAAEPALIVAFARDRAALIAVSALALPRYRRGARLWFAYPKRSSRLSADLDRDHGWEPVLGAGLLPVSQVALDADWSALRWRYRDEIARLTRREPPAT